MSEKCMQCGAPISGPMYKVHRFFGGVKKSEVDLSRCKKCERISGYT
jgi:hypothetical protein